MREGITPMTEAEWNACTDPKKMLEFLKGNRRVLGILRVPSWLAQGFGEFISAAAQSANSGCSPVRAAGALGT